jgi:hypothetical protein
MSAPSPPFAPHAELVCKAWLEGIPGLPAVAAQLPRDPATWPNGFVTYLGLGGVPVLDTPISRPVFQIDTWAASANSSKLPWGKANQLAQLILKATYPHGIRAVDLGPMFHRARVMGATVLSEPRRLFADAGVAARYTMSLQLTWAEA